MSFFLRNKKSILGIRDEQIRWDDQIQLNPIKIMPDRISSHQKR